MTHHRTLPALAAGLVTAVYAWRRIRRLQAALDEARTDPVTGLPVRRVAVQHLATVRGPVSVALVDVDDLHGINSAHGHAGGDDYLAAVAARLGEAAQPGDVTARLGGDELVLITRRAPLLLASALTAALRRPTTVGAARLAIRVSVGVCRADGGDPRTALGCADLAMYTAKQRGGGIEYYDPARDGRPLPAGSRPARRSRDGATQQPHR